MESKHNYSPLKSLFFKLDKDSEYSIKHIIIQIYTDFLPITTRAKYELKFLIYLFYVQSSKSLTSWN